MSSDNNYKNLRQSASNHKVEPPSDVWTRVEDKLDMASAKTDTLRRIDYKRLMMGVAASILILVVALNISRLNNSDHSAMGKIAEWEQLDTDLEYFYKVNDVRSLHNYYRNAGQLN